MSHSVTLNPKFWISGRYTKAPSTTSAGSTQIYPESALSLVRIARPLSVRGAGTLVPTPRCSLLDLAGLLLGALGCCANALENLFGRHASADQSFAAGEPGERDVRNSDGVEPDHDLGGRVDLLDALNHGGA